MSPCPLAAGSCTKMSSLLALSLLWIGPATNGISHIQSARPVRPPEVEPLQILHPTGLASGQALLFLQMHIRVMISDKCELVLADSLQIASPNLHGVHRCQTLLLRDCVIELSWYHLPGFKSQGAPILQEHSPNAPLTGICHDLKGLSEVRSTKHWCRSEVLL